MQRTPEPEELMNESAQALAYASADFSEANTLFSQLLQRLRPGPLQGRALDLGCGPADIPMALLRQHPALQIHALDGAPAMLEIARQRLEADPRAGSRLTLQCATLPGADLPRSHYDLILSNSLLHHLSDPNDLWLALKHCAADGAAILIMDLARPASADAVDALVDTYARQEPRVLRKDFRNSLHAAYTPEEVRQQLLAHNLAGVEVRPVSDRHWAALGRFSR